jgi:hypothetical protein
VGGGPPSPGAEGEGSPEQGGGTPQGGATYAETGAAESGSGESPGGQAAGAQGGEQGTAAGGDGIGREPGGDPLGARQGEPGATRGESHQARLRSGAGPSRAEVIETGAHKGFARSEYGRVFDDYSAVVEETLDTTAVPPARRYLVRRYFELIRPRTATRGTPP